MKDHTASDPKRKAPTSEQLKSICDRIISCSTLESLTQLTALSAREFTHADGASYIIREEDTCYYCDENAISPLWKGKRFPIYTCISGWSMVHNEVVSIEDIFTDGRIPIEAYRPTFVKSLLMIPVGKTDPIGAVGVYWAKKYVPSGSEVEILQTLVNANAAVLYKLK